MYWEKIWKLRFFRAVTITIFYFMLFLGTAQAQEKEISAETETEAQSEKKFILGIYLALCCRFRHPRFGFDVL